MHPSRKHEQGMGVGCPNPPLLFPLYLHIIDYHKPNYHFFQSQTSGLGRPKIPLEYKLQQNCYCCNSLYFTEIFTSSNMLSAVRNFLFVLNCIARFSHHFQYFSYPHFRIIQVTENREIRAKIFSPISFLHVIQQAVSTPFFLWQLNGFKMTPQTSLQSWVFNLRSPIFSFSTSSLRPGLQLNENVRSSVYFSSLNPFNYVVMLNDGMPGS